MTCMKQEFEQPVTSSVPCKTITDDYERTNRGDCVVIAHFNETSSNLVSPDKGMKQLLFGINRVFIRS